MMGFVSSVLGLGGSGSSGPGPQQAPIMQPTTAAQADQAAAQQQQALAQQQAFLQALQAQNGVGNQSAVFNQLQGVANGTGFNPAQAQLANATGANVANQAAMMASARGTGVNPGLIARQAAMQGAGIQQQAAGQSAALQAQQSMNAMNQMGGIANQQVAQQQGATNMYGQQALQGQQNVLGSIGQQNSALVGSQGSVNAANAQHQAAIAQGQANMMGNLMGAAGTAIGAIYGGPAGALIGQKMGTGIAESSAGGAADSMDGSAAGANYNPTADPGTAVAAKGGLITSSGAKAPRSKAAAFMMGNPQAPAMAQGGKVPALVSPGEKYLPPQDVKKVEAGANPMAVGEKIPGKPTVGGAKNSYANDTVSKTLDEGGIVLPRSVTQAKDAPEKAAKFVAAILKQQALKK